MTIETTQEVQQIDAAPEVENTEVEQPVEATNQPEQSETEELISPDDSKNVAKRIGKLSKKLSEKEQEIEYWRQQAMAAKTETAPVEVEPVEHSGKPQAGDFATNEDFIEALTEWKIEQREAAIEATRRANDIKNAYFERVESFKQTAPDFAIAVGEIQDVIGKDSNMVDFIIDSDVGPAIAYHLANNESELNRIMAMTPVRRIAALSKIESEFSTRRAANKTAQQASAPAARLTNNTGSVVPAGNNSKPEHGDFTAWKKWREQNRKK